MEEELAAPREGRPKKWIICLLVILLLPAAVWYLVFQVNRFDLLIHLAGESEMVLEYGEAYEEPGATVLFRGSLFCKNGITPEKINLHIDGEVDDRKLGKYELTYRADFYSWHEEATRTVRVVDTQCPVITLVPDAEETLLPGTPYKEAGYSAKDNHDGNLTKRVIRTEQEGKILYAVYDSSGNPAVAERKIPYHDPVPPEIRLEGGTEYTIPTGIFYWEPGYTAADNVDGDLTEAVAVEGTVDWLTPGVYPVTYSVTDAYQNTTTVIRNVTVTAAERPETVYPQGKTIYLTFDDGPGPYTKQLLDTLDRFGAKATFFVTNSSYNSAMKEIVRRGHSIGIHTVTHQYEEIYASPEAFFADLYKMQDIIYQNTGVRTTLMRFPGGSSNEISKGYCEGIMTLLTEAVQNAGFQYFDWNVSSGDAGQTQKTEEVAGYVIDGVKNNPVSIVLQHDIHGYSVAAVEDILTWGRNNGYQFKALTPNSPGFHHNVIN